MIDEEEGDLVMTAEERLAELLDQKDAEIAELTEKIETASDTKRWDWTAHQEMREPQMLPVPRLEIFLDEECSDDYNRVWVYRMIYRHLLDHCVAVPLGMTKQGGGNAREGQPLISYLPFRDGAHIRHDANAFGWPAFIVWGDEHTAIPLEGRL